MLGRFYIMLRLFDHYTYWSSERALRVSKINGFKADYSFALKAYLKVRPFTVLFVSMAVSIAVFGYAVIQVEKGIPSETDSRTHNFDKYIFNGFWCIIVTMTTIGYGEIYPITHLGRIVIFLACIWGIFILGLFVTVLEEVT